MGVAIIVGVVFLLIGFILAMMFTPVGWIVLFIGGVILMIALATAGAHRRAQTFPARKKRHGPEDLGRGSNDDPMEH